MCLQEPLRHYIDGTVVLVDLYPQVVTNGGEVVRLRKVPQAVVLHCILAGRCVTLISAGCHLIVI